jgi:hypothetical protein
MRLRPIRAAALAALLAATHGSTATSGQVPRLLADAEIDALASELSGELAKRNLEAISREHRTRGSRPFRHASELLADRARAYGLDEVSIDEFPADGTRVYGTQRSRPGWDAEFAELWEMRRQEDRWVPHVRLASWETQPITLAQDSESADVTAELVDVGAGTSEADYAGTEVRGKLVLTSSQPGAVAPIAVARLGAAGIVSYAQNQPTAWRGDNDALVRWGHLETFDGIRTFGFMVSLRTARTLGERLGRGETVVLRAVVKAGQRPGVYSIATAAIRGADPALRNEEIVFSCHLDHPRPGANDNASGCVTILEVGRTFAKLIADGRLPRPARTIRFVWPPEIEGTIVRLNAKPEWAARIRAVVHMDMVGGGPETKAVFHVTRGPRSLPSIVHDVADAFGRLANEQSLAFASTGAARWPLVSPEGGKEPLLADLADFSMGSDHQVYSEGSWRIPAIYLNDWPDRYIHTNWDTPAVIDPTKLTRAAFVGAASAWFLSNLRSPDSPALAPILAAAATRRAAATIERAAALPEPERDVLARDAVRYERGVIDSLRAFGAGELPAELNQVVANVEALLRPTPAPEASGDARLVFSRAPEPKGPMGGFGYDYFTDKLGAEKAGSLALLRHRGLRGSGGEYAYEVLNLVDGSRTVQEIRDIVSAEFGPVPIAAILEYLRALESIGVVRERAR